MKNKRDQLLDPFYNYLFEKINKANKGLTF